MAWLRERMTRAQLIEWAKSEIDAFPSLKTCSTAAAVLEAEAAAEGLAKALEATIDSFGSHSAHWDHTMQHGAGCEQCHRERDARVAARAALAAWRSRGGAATDSAERRE